MSNYNHTAADAIALAATCEKRIQSGTGVALNPAETHLAMTALKCLAENLPRFNIGDKLVFRTQFKEYGGKVYEVCKQFGAHQFECQSGRLNSYYYFRLATPAEIAAGHRIDEVQK